MRRINKCKKGFTLVELMLAIAIMMLVMPCVIMLLMSISEANRSVFKKNDVVDYAYANRLAIESRIINAQSIGSGDHAISVSNGIFTFDGNPLIDVETYFSHPNGTQTWDVYPRFIISGVGVVDYIIEYREHGTTHILYTDEGSFYIPHMNPANSVATDGSTLLFSTY